MQGLKKLMVVLLFVSSFVMTTSASAYYQWNQHYTRCYGANCTHYTYHKYCQWGHCWTHWNRQNWHR